MLPNCDIIVCMSLTKEFLKALGQGLDLIQEISDARYLPYKLIWGDLEGRYDKTALKMSLGRAVKKGFIKKQIRQEEVYLALTELGRQLLVKDKPGLALKPELKDEGWDGRYRLVIFDIPEKDRFIRDRLREQLKNLGAVGWQKSVWVTTKDITKAVNDLVKSNGLEDYILMIEVEELNNEKLEKLTRLADKSDESI